MHFKIYFKWIILFIVCLFSFGCNRFLKYINKPKPNAHFELESTECFSKIPVVLNDYFHQQKDSAKWKSTWKCVDASIDQFKVNIEGEKEKQYSSAEVKRFFQKYIFKKEISDGLVLEIMKLKQALIGGSLDVITYDDFDRIQLLINKSSQEMENIYPYLGIFLFRDPLNITNVDDQKKINIAVDALKNSIHEILQLLPPGAVNYPIPQIQLMMKEVAQFAGITDPEHPFMQWQKKLPLFDKLKVLLVGNSIEIQSPAEVEIIWFTLTDVLKSAIFYLNGMGHLSFAEKNNFQVWDDWIEFNFTILIKTFQFKKQATIPFEQIDTLLDDLYEQKIISMQIQKDTLKRAYRRLLIDFIDEEHHENLNEINIQHIYFLQRDYRSYKMIQLASLQLFQEKEYRNPNEIKQFMAKFKMKDQNHFISPYSTSDQNYIENSWNHFLSLVNSPNKHFWNNENQVILDDSDVHQWSYHDLWLINVLSVVAQKFIQRFSHSRTVANELDVLYPSELKAFFKEYEQIGVELSLFDPRNIDTSLRSTYEADFFTPSGNGDFIIQFSELVDLLSLLYSGGSVSVEKMKDLAVANHFITPNLDVFNKPYITPEGVSKILRNHFAEVFSNLPQFNLYIQKMTSEQWHSFYNSLIQLSKLCPLDQNGIDTTAQRNMAVIFNYIEDLFVLFDQNKNGLLNEQEIEKAYPRFAQFIVERTKIKLKDSNPTTYNLLESIGYDWKKLGLDVFKFIVFKGRVPTPSEVMSLKWDEFWGKQGIFQDADRSQIARVFSALKSEMPLTTPLCEN